MTENTLKHTDVHTLKHFKLTTLNIKRAPFISLLAANLSQSFELGQTNCAHFNLEKTHLSGFGNSVPLEASVLNKLQAVLA